MIGFFTRLPVPKIEFTDERYRKAMIFLPLVGLVIGAVLVLIQMFLVFVETPQILIGAVLTCAYIFLSGGLHFDGLADTCDGFFSGRSREQALEIMKDSRIGVFGTLGLFMAGIFYFALFTQVSVLGLLVFPLCGRACCLISASLAPYAREEGMGKATSERGGAGSVLSAIVSIIGASFLTIPLAKLVIIMGARFEPLLTVGTSEFPVAFTGVIISFITIAAQLAAGAAVLVTVYMTMSFKKRLGGVTGDTFGAVIEVSSLVFMFVFILLWKAFSL